jgi:hypothetical protein
VYSLSLNTTFPFPNQAARLTIFVKERTTNFQTEKFVGSFFRVQQCGDVTVIATTEKVSLNFLHFLKFQRCFLQQLFQSAMIVNEKDGTKRLAPVNDHGIFTAIVSYQSLVEVGNKTVKGYAGWTHTIDVYVNDTIHYPPTGSSDSGSLFDMLSNGFHGFLSSYVVYVCEKILVIIVMVIIAVSLFRMLVCFLIRKFWNASFGCSDHKRVADKTESLLSDL